jgi:MFS family permease
MVSALLYWNGLVPKSNLNLQEDAIELRLYLKNYDKEKKMKNTTLRNLFILVGSTLSVLQGAIVAPALPKISEHFAGVENIEFLSKLILSISPLFLALFSPIAGIMLEKYGRKNVLIIATVLYAFAGTTGFYLDNIFLILVGRALLGITISAMMSGFIVVLGDLYKGNELNKYMGIQGALMSFGGMVYLLVGGALANISWNLPFVGYAFSLIITIGLLLFLDETKPQNITNEKPNLETKTKFSKEIIFLNVIAFLVMVIYLMVPTQLPFFLSNTFKVSPQSIGGFLALWILASSIASLSYSKIRKSLNISQIYVVGLCLWTIGYVFLYFSPSIPLILVSLAIAGIGNGLVVPNLKTELLELVTPNQRGKQSGILTASLYFGQFFSPILMQPIISNFTIKEPFIFTAIILIIIAVVYFRKNINGRDRIKVKL